MSLEIFKPSDFQHITISVPLDMIYRLIAIKANYILHERLLDKGVVVYGWEDHAWSPAKMRWSTNSLEYNKPHKFTALIVNKELVDKNCDHGEFVRGSKIIRDNGIVKHSYICELCGAKLKPTGWQVVEE